MSQTIRAFIAVPIPSAVISHLSLLQSQMRKLGFPQLKWVKPDNIHLTLKFFGDILVDDISLIGEIMAMAAGSEKILPIKLSTGGLGVFPSLQRARVIWVALKGETHLLIGFQQRLETALEEIGFPAEKRPFKGHLTLGRVKQHIPAELLLKAFREFGNLESVSFSADRIILYKSDLKTGGAEYTPLLETVFIP